ncbi:MAG: ribonuclease T [Sphingomonas bacterium]
MKNSKLVGALLLVVPGVAQAQTYKCDIPRNVPRPHTEAATASEPQRVLPIGGYTLAVTWAPQYCHTNARKPFAKLECGSGNRFGFTLHGLWPDGVGKEWPQYCTSAALLPQPLIKQHLCSTPSAQLLQHEWTKHGTCMGTTPAAYFSRSTGLYAKLRYPDMDALSRKRLTASGFAAAMAAANPGLPANAIRVTANKQGWLDELWLCLDKKFAYARCATGSGGLDGKASLKIWRGPRLTKP